MDKEEKVTDLWEDYQDGVDWQNVEGMRENYPRFVDYYEGNQWGAIEEGTECMPRIVLNMVEKIVNTKVSNINRILPRTVFKCEEKPEIAEKLTRYYAWWAKKAKLRETDEKALLDGAVLGTYAYHVYWDENKERTAVELLEPLDVLVANPLEEDIQQDKWVMVVSREDIDFVKGIADEGVDKDMIVSEDKNDNNPYQNVEQKNSDLVTLLTKYFKKDGEVWCERATKNVIVNEPFCLTPKMDDGELVNDNVKAEDYQIVVASYRRKRNSLFGQGEVVNLIEGQQAVNSIISMQAYNIMLNGWSKYKVTPDALKDQIITNEVGQVLIDHSKGGNGIQVIPSGGFSNAPIQALTEIMAKFREISGTNEIVSGDYIKSGMSGAAIAQMQAQANVPIENDMYRHWRWLEDVARAWLQSERTHRLEAVKYTYKDDEGVLQDEELSLSEIAGLDIDIVVESSGGTRSSTAGDINFLDRLVEIQAISPLQYVKLFPDDAISNKEQIVALMESQEANMVAQLTAKINDQDQKMLASAKTIEELMKIVEDIKPTIQENNSLRAMLAEQQAVCYERMAETQQQAMNVVGEAVQDASLMAQELKSREGTNPIENITQ